jgi:predicted O-methyltransferase YrrM
MKAASRTLDSPPSVALWIAAGLVVPAEVHERLRGGGTALEIGCGGGLGCLALAEAYPSARIVGHDRDPDAIERARTLARAAGLAERISFSVTGSERLPRAAYDLATLQALSGPADTVLIMNAVRNALVPDGVCVLVEPTDHLTARIWNRRATVDNLRALAEKAGFSRLRRLDGGSVDAYELRR